MLYGDFVRSPYAHARIKKIDASKAKARSGRARRADRRRPEAARPALHADARRRRAGGARRGEGALPESGSRLRHRRRPLHRRRRASNWSRSTTSRCRSSSIRSRRWRRTRRCCARTSRTRPTARTASASTTTTSSPGRWATRTATDAAFAKAEVTIKELISYQRVHPCPLETCQCVASFDKIRGELTVWGTFQAPHVIRTVASLISKIPEHKIHVIAPDIGGGFGNKVGAYAGYICAIVASIVTGRPVKWVEDRIENLTTTAFARDYHMTDRDRGDQGRPRHRPARLHHRRPRRLRRLRRPDASGRPASSTSSPARTTSRSRMSTSTASIPTRRRAASPIAARSASPRRPTASSAAMDILAQKLGMDPAELRMKNLIKREQFPYTSALGWEYDSGDYHTALQQGDGHRRLQAAPRRAEGEAGGLQARRDARADGHRRRLLHRDRRRRAVAELRHPRHRHVRFGRDPHPSDRRRRSPASAPSRRARATRPPTRRSSPARSASPPTTSPSRRATPTPRPTASAPTARARRRSRAPRPPWRRARSRPRRR